MSWRFDVYDLLCEELILGLAIARVVKDRETIEAIATKDLEKFEGGTLLHTLRMHAIGLNRLSVPAATFQRVAEKLLEIQHIEGTMEQTIIIAIAILSRGKENIIRIKNQEIDPILLTAMRTYAGKYGFSDSQHITVEAFANVAAEIIRIL